MVLVEYSGGLVVNYEAASGRDGSDNGPNAPPYTSLITTPYLTQPPPPAAEAA